MKYKNGFRSGLFFIISLMTVLVFGQEKKSPVKFAGEFGLFGDFYDMDSDSLHALSQRRPAVLGRFVMNTEISVKDFSMPFTAALPTANYSNMLPNVPTIPGDHFGNFKTLFSNPINRVGIAPKYKWAQVMLGSQVPRYSELSVGDLAIFGAGINLTPGKFQFSFFSGTSQLAIEENLSKNIQGIYARKLQTAKIGFGKEDSSHIYLVACRMEDDTSSLLVSPVSMMPQKGILSSIDFRINFNKKAFVKGEVAASAFTRDVRNKEMPDFSPSLPKIIFTSKESSRVDYASVLSGGWNGKSFGIKATARYYGDGFVPLGYPFLQTDRLEVTVDPRFEFFKNKVQISGSVGRRVNNLSGIRAATTTQTISAANINVQFSDKFSVAGSYSNFGFRNSIINDTFSVEMVTNSWSISPSYNHTNKSGLHNFSFIFAQNVFTDFNTISGAFNSNDANNAVLSYMFSLLKKPLSISTLLSYFDNKTSYGNLVTKSLNFTVAYKFLKNKLVTTAGLTMAESSIDAGSSGSQLMSLFGAKYILKKKIQFGAQASVNLFKYGEARPGISFRENLVRVSITYKF